MAIEWRKQFDLEIVDPRPGLVPFVLGEPERTAFAGLSGISLPVIAGIDGTSFEEAMLITHRGLSGPAILQISSFWRKGATITLDLLPRRPGDDWLRAARNTNATAKSLLGREWPARFAELWCDRYISSKPLAQMTKAEFEDLAQLVHAWPIQPHETEGYPKAEVTVGGVSIKRTFIENDGNAPRAGTLFHWRSRRRDRLAGRLQFPMGLGERACRGRSCLTSKETFVAARRRAESAA
mgnify:CR=1 FL=1